LDKDGTLLQVNKTMLDYKGFTLEEMKGVGTRERISRDVHPDDLDAVDEGGFRQYAPVNAPGG
jgi:hypothetical protein